MKKIDGVARPLVEILRRTTFKVDYYQRDYQWGTKQLRELVSDLFGRFDEAWDPTHAPRQVQHYPHYFLGSIVLAEKDGERYIVDGQQRLTSLTLLLTYLRHLQHGAPRTVAIDDLILSEEFGEQSFNLDVPGRTAVMAGLYDVGRYALPDDAEPSARTLVARYDDLAEAVPDDLAAERLPFFLDWLLNCVQIVQITAYSNHDAYEIFETMNDRGLKLAPADMLRGYVMAHLDDAVRSAVDTRWRTRMRELAEREPDGDADFLKTWLRSQYAQTIRDRSRGAHARDWDRLGTEFHRWVRDHEDELGLKAPGRLERFARAEFDFYARHHLRVLDAASWRATVPGLELVGYNADHGFTLQNQLLLAPLVPDDDDETAARKMAVVSAFVDITLARRIWNFRSIAYSTMQYAMFIVMRDVRGMAVDDLARHLVDRLRADDVEFDNPWLRVHQQNRQSLHRLLARITDHVAVESGEPSRYLELTSRRGVRYEVEHIWANHYELHQDEFAHEHDFREHRDRIGDLLLVPKSINASYGDAPYVEKLPHYFAQNILARSLHPDAYEHNPGFARFIQRSGLPFRAYRTFAAADIDERGVLYREIAKQIWDPERLLRTAGLAPG